MAFNEPGHSKQTEILTFQNSCLFVFSCLRSSDHTQTLVTCYEKGSCVISKKRCDLFLAKAYTLQFLSVHLCLFVFLRLHSNIINIL